MRLNRNRSVRASASNAISVAGRRQTATVGLWQNRAWSWIGIWSIPVSPLLRRDDLRPHASCNRTWSAPANSYPAIHETLVDPFGCYPGKKGHRRPVRYEGSVRGRDRSLLAGFDLGYTALLGA